MRRNPVIRLLHALWAFTFLLNAAGEATQAHGSAHHGGTHGAVAVADVADATHSGGHHDAGDAAGYHADAPAEGEVPSGHAEKCICALFCGASSAQALSVDAPAGAIEEFDAEPSTLILPARIPPLRRPIPHFIAYPNGPPALI